MHILPSNDRGELITKYSKIHLFNFDQYEAVGLSAGQEVVIILTPIGISGLASGYDLRCPEISKLMVRKDATSFLINSGWHEKRIFHWNALLTAPAIKNQTLVSDFTDVGFLATLVCFAFDLPRPMATPLKI